MVLIIVFCPVTLWNKAKPSSLDKRARKTQENLEKALEEQGRKLAAERAERESQLNEKMKVRVAATGRKPRTKTGSKKARKGGGNASSTDDDDGSDCDEKMSPGEDEAYDQDLAPKGKDNSDPPTILEFCWVTSARKEGYF